MADASKLPTVGEKPPLFALPSSDGKTIDLAALLGKQPIVLYFYPKADTPGCTTQACGFRDTAADYKKVGTIVLGVSPDPLDRVTKFADKFHVNFPLLADAGFMLYQSVMAFGSKRACTGRSTWESPERRFSLERTVRSCTSSRR